MIQSELKLNPGDSFLSNYICAAENGDKSTNALIIQNNKNITFCFHSREKHDPWGKQIIGAAENH